MPGPLLQGDVPYGAVVIRWVDGRPLRAWRGDNPDRNADIPPAFWDAVLANVRQDLWVPFTYLAFPESDYVEDAHNPSPLEDSWGALQVNRVAWPQYSVSDLTTYTGNLRAAQHIFDLQGFAAWWNSAALTGLLSTSYAPSPTPPAAGGPPGATPPPVGSPAGGGAIDVAIDYLSLGDALGDASAAFGRAADIFRQAGGQGGPT